MKKLRILLVVFTFINLLFTFPAPVVQASETVSIHFFYDKICAHCQLEKTELERLSTVYSNLVVHYYEITDYPENYALFLEVKTVFDLETANTPFTVIGGVALVGYNPQVRNQIEKLITRYTRQSHVDIIDKVIRQIEVLESDFDSIELLPGDTVVLPILGEVAIDELGLLVAAVVIGAVDGFNPCAMWVLIFLITMLLHTKDRKRMWILGVSFLVASAFVYFLFMVAWLQVAVSVVAISWLRISIGVLAFGFGSWSLSKFMKTLKQTEVGCEVTTDSSKKRLMDRIRKVIATQNLALATLGVVLLAFSVNLIELACSAGLPLLFTQILAFNQLSTSAYYGYILIYILFFLLDDLLVFSIAMFTMKVSGISNRYQRYAHLVGGLIMILMAIFLIFFPNFLSFTF